jgi:hypothetical protein
MPYSYDSKPLDWWKLKDKELNSLIRKALKFYIASQVEFVEFSVWDKGAEKKPSTSKSPKMIESPNLASVIASYVALVSSEEQAKLNNRVQVLILLVAASSLLTSLLTFFRH